MFAYETDGLKHVNLLRLISKVKLVSLCGLVVLLIG